MDQSIKQVNFESWATLQTQLINNRTYKLEQRGNVFRISQYEAEIHSKPTRHYSCTIVDNGIQKNCKFDVDSVAKVFSQLTRLGHTEAFIINRDDNDREDVEVMSLITHKETKSEQSFTATGTKLHYHWPIFQKYSETGFGSIIRATLTLHQVCASKCQFCSTVGRNKRDSVTYEEAKRFIDTLYFSQERYNEVNFPKYNDMYQKVSGSGIRLKGLIFSGGGQPNLWPQFSSLVEYLARNTEIELGLITNGFPRNVSEEIYEFFKWIRISITPSEASAFYPDGDFRRQYIPASLGRNGQTIGLSYVYGPWTSDEEIVLINEFAVARGFSYVRVLTDCNLSRHSQLQSHLTLSNRLLSLGLVKDDGEPLSKTFHQLKYHSNKSEAMEVWGSGQCYLQTYNAFWDTTGHEENGYSYIYPCDSVTVLSEPDGTVSERRFNHERWGTYRNTEAEKLFTEPVKPFFDPRDNCSACLFIRNNRTVKELANSRSLSIVNLNQPEHVNFP